MYSVRPHRDIYAGSIIAFFKPEAFEFTDCALEVPDVGAWGIATCYGPALVFHDDKCFEKWRAASRLEASLAANSGEPWVEREGMAKDSALRTPSCDSPPLDKVYYPAGSELINTQDGQPVSTVNAKVVLTTETDSHGRPTATVTQTRVRNPFGHTTVTECSAQGSPTATFTAQVITYTDANGRPVTTNTRTLSASHTLLTLRDSHGTPTATLSIDLPSYETPPLDIPITLIFTDSNGRPTTTITASPRHPKPSSFFSTPKAPSPGGSGLYILSQADYYLLLFLPVLLTVLVSILAEMVSSNLHTLLPLHALSQEGGGTSAAETLLFPRGAVRGFGHAVYLLVRKREPLSFLA